MDLAAAMAQIQSVMSAPDTPVPIVVLRASGKKEEIVADQRSIDFVYRFIPTAEPFGTKNAEQAMLQIQLRTFLKYPEAVDITQHVMDELDLE